MTSPGGSKFFGPVPGAPRANLGGTFSDIGQGLSGFIGGLRDVKKEQADNAFREARLAATEEAQESRLAEIRLSREQRTASAEANREFIDEQRRIQAETATASQKIADDLTRELRGGLSHNEARTERRDAEERIRGRMTARLNVAFDTGTVDALSLEALKSLDPDGILEDADINALIDEAESSDRARQTSSVNFKKFGTLKEHDLRRLRGISVDSPSASVAPAAAQINQQAANPQEQGFNSSFGSPLDALTPEGLAQLSDEQLGAASEALKQQAGAFRPDSAGAAIPGLGQVAQSLLGGVDTSTAGTHGIPTVQQLLRSKFFQGNQ